MALPGLNRGPRTPAPPQTVVHKRLLDSEASQSCNSTAVTICTTCHNIKKQCSLLYQLTYDCIYIYDFQNEQGMFTLILTNWSLQRKLEELGNAIFKSDRSLHPRLRYFIPGFSPRRIPGLTGSAYVKFLVEKEAIGFVFSRQFQYSLSIILYCYFRLVFNNIVFNRRWERSLRTCKEGNNVWDIAVKNCSSFLFLRSIISTYIFLGFLLLEAVSEMVPTFEFAMAFF